MKKISEFFYRNLPGWLVLAALCLFLAFSFLSLPGQNAISEKYSGGAGSPDTSLFYSGNDLYRMAGAYGAEGRAAYIHARWTFDLAFPLIYTFFLVTASSWLLNKTFQQGSKWRLLNLIPLAAMLMDLQENIMTSRVMARFPLHSPLAEILAPIFTPFKWLLVGGSFVLLIVNIFILLGLKLKRKNM